jgi:RNase P subunit RPR2
MPITLRETQLVHSYIKINDLHCRKCAQLLAVANIVNIETVDKEILKIVQVECPGCGVIYFIDPKFIPGL